MQPPQDPFRPQGTAPEEGTQPQWTQVPFPNQLNNNGQPGNGYSQQAQPGQVPPPAQLQPIVMYPQATGNAAQPQWTQVPFPNQLNNNGQPGNGYSQQAQPGQVPPPAQLQPQVTYPQAVHPSSGGNQLQQAQPGQASRPDGKQAVYQPPRTGMPSVKKNNNRTVYIVLVVLVLVFAVLVILRMTAPGQVNFATVQSGSMNSRFTGDAVIVRNEMVETQEGVSQIDYIAKEGELLERSTLVATVYDSAVSSKDWKNLANSRAQIKVKQKALMGDVANDSRMLNLLNQVIERGMEVQRMVQEKTGDLIKQEELLQKVIEDRQLYMRQNQKFKEDSKLTLLWQDETIYLNKIANSTNQKYTTTAGLVSFYSDGFETALNTNTYNDFSPTQVRSLYNGNIPETTTPSRSKKVSIYRLVKQEPWVVLMLCNEKEWMPVQGRTYKMMIESFDNIVVDATVESFTLSGGELLVRLLVYDTSKLPSVMYLRSCKVQLGDNVNSLSVPSRALFKQDGRQGVVLMTPGGEFWTGVEVISNDGKTAYVIPENAGVLYEGTKVRLF